jgi:hypothetical protein
VIGLLITIISFMSGSILLSASILYLSIFLSVFLSAISEIIKLLEKLVEKNN